MSGHRPNSFWVHSRPRYVLNYALRIKTTFCLGGVSFLAFVVLTGTGVLLLFHYQPGEKAYSSLVEIHSVIPYGELIRSLHFWAAQLMVFSVFLHMVRVVLSHAYRPPRELNWVIGVVLLGLTFLLDFSGYLLRGNQESGAAATVGQSLLRIVPGGNMIAGIIFGNPNPLTGSTLNLYIWHSFILAVFLAILQIWHFWRIRRDGGIRSL